MFIMSLWNVKEPSHNSRRVGDEVPGDVGVWMGGYSSVTCWDNQEMPANKAMPGIDLD